MRWHARATAGGGGKLDILPVGVQLALGAWVLAPLGLAWGFWLLCVFDTVRGLQRPRITTVPVHFDPITECRRALAVMSAWEHTASLTGSRRHAITATTCRDIAIERLLTAMAAEIATEQKREVLRISREICDEADRHESRINITEIRAILARMTAEIDQPNQPF